MTKHQIADIIREKTDIKKKDILIIIDSFIEEIKELTLNKNEKVELRGFGTFHKGEKKGKKIFSPIAKKIIDIPDRSTLMFKASKATKEII